MTRDPRDGGVRPHAPRVRPSMVLVGVALAFVTAALAGPASGSPGHLAAKTGTTTACTVAKPTMPSGDTATTVEVQSASADQPAISMVRYPRPDRAAGSSNPWSQWGQGLVLSDGRFLSAMGDHRGADGNSYLFVYEPATHDLIRFSDVLSLVDHQPGSWGYGKVHGQIVAGKCGTAYFSTYWGSRTDMEFSGSYRGDHLFRIDTATMKVDPLGVPVEDHGVPSLASASSKGLVFGEAVDPAASEKADRDVGAFFVYDTAQDKVVFRSDDRSHSLFRNVLVDRRGRAYIAGADGNLLRYDPGADALVDTGTTLPGGGPLRASTVPDTDGTVYGVTEAEPNEFFAVEPDGSVRELGKSRGYTASMALDSKGSRFFYVPDADGDSFEHDTPLIAVDTKTGAQTVIAKLNPLAEDHLGLTVNGSYDLAFDARRNRLFVGLNAGKTHDEPWGEVVLAVVDLGGSGAGSDAS